MTTVSVAELKSRLSEHLAAVRKGREILVTSHRHPIARIVPLDKASAERLQVIPSKRPMSALKKIKGLNLKVDLVADLLADRRRR